MTEPTPRRADQLIVGDQILPAFLPAFCDQLAEVVFVRTHDYEGARWVFAAYRTKGGFYDSTSFLPDAELLVIPADLGASFDSSQTAGADDTPARPPASRRYEPHFDAVIGHDVRVPAEDATLTLPVVPTDDDQVDEPGPLVHLDASGARTLCGVAIIDLLTTEAWTNDRDAVTCEDCLDKAPF